MTDGNDTRSGGESETNTVKDNVFNIVKGIKGARKAGALEKVMPYVDSLLALPSRDFDLPEAYALVKLRGRAKILVEVNPEFFVLTPTDTEEVEDTCMRFSKNAGGRKPLEPSMAVTIARFWRANAKPISADKIAPLRELSEQGYCWHRLPFDYKELPTPAFDELFGRMENADAIKEWIGALTISDAERQHYVWIQGEGRQGKGALGRFLQTLMGPSYRSEVPPDKNVDRFWTYNLIGARLVVFPDCEDSHFTTKGLCKSITGGDPIRVEEKGGKVSTATLDCMLLFLSQEKPYVSSEKADTRRIIYSRIGDLPEGTRQINQATYDALLWDEAPGFLFECRRRYREMAARGAGYSLQQEVLDELVAENEMPFDAFFDTYFELAAPDPAKVDRDQPYVSAKDFQTILKVEGKWLNTHRQRDFLAWLKRRHHVESRIVMLPGKLRERRYVGVQLSDSGKRAARGDSGVGGF